MMTTWMFCLASPAALQDRLRVVAQQLLDLGVADDRRAFAGGALGRRTGVRAGDRAAARAGACRTRRQRHGALRSPMSLCARVSLRLADHVADAVCAHSGCSRPAAAYSNGAHVERSCA